MADEQRFTPTEVQTSVPETMKAVLFFPDELVALERLLAGAKYPPEHRSALVRAYRTVARANERKGMLVDVIIDEPPKPHGRILTLTCPNHGIAVEYDLANGRPKNPPTICDKPLPVPAGTFMCPPPRCHERLIAEEHE